MKEKTKEYIEEKEKFLLQNITLISFSIIGIILFLFFYQQIFCIINNIFDINYSPKTLSLETTISLIGAIIAFWYGYKKYERDKELEFLNNSLIQENIISKWKHLYNLKNKLFIKDELLKSDNNKIDSLLTQMINNEESRNYFIKEIYGKLRFNLEYEYGIKKFSKNENDKKYIEKYEYIIKMINFYEDALSPFTPLTH